MDKRIPVIVFGDGPRSPTGLGRIARDLSARLYAAQEELGIRFAQVGVDDPGGWHWQAWDFYGFQPTLEDYGRIALTKACLDLQAETGRRPIVLTIFDPSRVYDLVRDEVPGERIDALTTIADLWSYFPIDAINASGAVGGPAMEAVGKVQRVLGYGRWGAKVLKATREMYDARFEGTLKHGLKPLRTGSRGISYLPHGLEPGVWKPTTIDQVDPLFHGWRTGLSPSTLVIGCVATNQPRKDFGTLFGAAAKIRELYGINVAVWLHTDRLVGPAWDVGELAFQFGFSKRNVLATYHELPDVQLAARYTASNVTLAPGLGEGFGYPIVESLACGTPVVHVQYAGGTDLIADPRLLVSPSAWRLESIYALLRPVLEPQEFAERLMGVATDVDGNPERRAYYQGSVAHLSWEHLWPRWRAWIVKGLSDVRRHRRLEDAAGPPAAPPLQDSQPGGGDIGGERPGAEDAGGDDRDRLRDV